MNKPNALMFQVSPTSGEPIYRQLMQQIERLIAGGQLQPGERLPSVRDVATAMEVNPMTVSKAYSLMESAGWLARLRGKGMVVANALPKGSDDAPQLLRPAIGELLAQARQAGVTDKQLISLIKQAIKEDEQ